MNADCAVLRAPTPAARFSTSELDSSLGPLQGLRVQAGVLVGEEALTQVAGPRDKKGSGSSASGSTSATQWSSHSSAPGVCVRQQSLVAWQGPPECVPHDVAGQ
jgi:hypothetical protein